MEALAMCRLIAVVVFVFISVNLSPTLSFGESNHVVDFEMSASNAEEALESLSSASHLKRNKRDTDAKCKKQEDTFLTEVRSGKKRLETTYKFANKTKFSLAMAWASDNDKGTLIVVTTEIIMMMFATSNVWRSNDYGRTWSNIDDKVDNSIFRKGNGLQRNPHDASMVYLLSYHDYMYVTENGGEMFVKRKVVDAETNVPGSLIFHPDKISESVMVIADDEQLFATKNNFVDKRKLTDYAVSAKWSSQDLNEPNAIYAMVAKNPPVHSFFGHFRIYNLVKFEDMDSSPNVIYKNVIAFGIQGGFLYASVYADANPTQTSPKLMVVSTDGGKTWNEAQLPTVTGDRFYSVMDMSEHLIFMHVDNPGDTGTGTLYTSAKDGVVYSESLQHHLYPNYDSVTDFYKVESMRGVYMASQLNKDNSIHTVITFDRGGVWKPIVPQEPCKDTTKPCQLQIHNYYSISRGVKARPPLSTENAPGLVLVHGHAADALQKTPPDVYITTDGGYNWRKTLEGPHHYQIADSGGLLVAVATSPNDLKPNKIKFSTDEGNCWHEYQFTNESIIFTGLLTEPGGKSMTVSIWGYTDDQDRKWVVNVINFETIITRHCDNGDYTPWTPHSELRRGEGKGVEGCLLGMKETFKKLKADSWCQNGYDNDRGLQSSVCTCTREDYECDYSYYRPDGSDNCIMDPNFSGKDINICLRGHEETIVTLGYRKIPGDQCSGGVSFTEKRKLDLSVECAEGSKDFVINMETPVKLSGHGALIGVIVIAAFLLIIVVCGFFGYKMYLLRKHRVVYRYSMLNQGDPETYDNELENALTAHSLYEDSDDETLPATTVKTANGNPFLTSPSTRQNKVKSFHDDSDDDLLE